MKARYLFLVALVLLAYLFPEGDAQRPLKPIAAADSLTESPQTAESTFRPPSSRPAGRRLQPTDRMADQDQAPRAEKSIASEVALPGATDPAPAANAVGSDSG